MTSHLIKNLQELELKEKHIVQNIQNIIQYPDLLESQNNELKKIKDEIQNLQKKINTFS